MIHLMLTSISFNLWQLGQQIWINKKHHNSTTHWQFHHRSTFVSKGHDHVCYVLAFSVQDISDLLNVLEAGDFETDLPDFCRAFVNALQETLRTTQRPFFIAFDIHWSSKTDDWRYIISSLDLSDGHVSTSPPLITWGTCEKSDLSRWLGALGILTWNGRMRLARMGEIDVSCSKHHTYTIGFC